MFFIWITLLVYAIFLAPGECFDNDALLSLLIGGQFEQVDPLIVMIFSFLGLYPLLFAFLILPQDNRKLTAWPFVFLSFFLGAFALLPYFSFRGRVSKVKSRTSTTLLTALNSRIFIIVLLILVIFLYGIGLFTGSFSAYQQAFLSSQFVSIMTMDFFILIWLSYYVMKNDYHEPKSPLVFLPLIGLLYLLLLRINQRKKRG
ncbi:hypothetical protein [Bacillus sp. CGMCC 1.16541]|uniref:hypothetical protein n=1 Tax=Bacillus sp. CGMCC 1.16541 TaxID=2185143 RepID=UPI000D72C2CC|nr:hypothetical protein [Bacillus sp. CGMCC 1.16541]